VHRALRTPAVRACALVALAALAACGGGGSGESTTTVGGAPPTSSSTTAATVAIGGPPIDAAVANEFYQYVPEMGDTSGAEVVFAVDGKPAWASFDAAAGTLSGTPSGADVGSRRTVRISAVAGGSRTSVEFQLQVVASADGVASVSLDAPVTRTDGTALQNLAGYRIYYGKTATRLDRFVDVKDRTATSAVVGRLTPGTWFFAATAYDANGFESEPTGLAQKQIG
jgi:hypothetical protein